MQKRTKIVATLGPATDDPVVLERMVKAGVNMVRLNFSHSNPQEHENRVKEIRDIAAKLNTHVAVMGDLQGPKIRISTFKNGSVVLKKHQSFVLDADLPPGEGDETQVGIDYKRLPEDLKPGDILLLDDGKIQLIVTAIHAGRIHTTVYVAGPLSDHKGINKKGGGLNAKALTDKDKEDIKLAAKLGVDYLAVSFPRNGDDIRYARSLLEQAGSSAKLVAKVERAEAVKSDESMTDIILASDVIMVARGDLGIEIGDPNLMGIQKRLIKLTRQLNRVVITATQMMESMINSPLPTRAEVMDVANAVLDCTDAVMLSAESAVGKYPVETVHSMAEVLAGAEADPSMRQSSYRVDREFKTPEETIAMSTMYAANHLEGIKGIIALTRSGNVVKLMSRLKSNLPIYALSKHEQTLNWVALYRGVTPVYFEEDEKMSRKEITLEAIAKCKELGYFNSGDKVILTYGDHMEEVGSTNSMKILIVK
ncbi:MAG: pyruvate kinase [Succinivibrionaceae bacterium]